MRQVRAGVWSVQASLGFDAAGKRIRLSRTIHGTRADAEDELQRLLAMAGKVSSGRSLTLRRFVVDQWLPYKLDQVRRRTYDGYESKMRLYVLPALGHVHLADLDPLIVGRWVGALKKRTDIGPRTVYHAFWVLHNALSDAQDWGRVQRVAAGRKQAPAVESVRPDVLTPAEANAVLDLFAGDRIEPAIVLALAAGLRRSELCGLRWPDVDFKAGTVNVREGRHRVKGGLILEKPKTTNSRRTLSLPTWALNALKPHRGFGPVVPVSPDGLSSRYKRVMDGSGLRFVKLKNLRHSSATILLARGVNIVDVSRRLGHSNVSTTDTFYLAPGRAEDAAAAAVMDGVRTLPKARAKKGSAS